MFCYIRGSTVCRCLVVIFVLFIGQSQFVVCLGVIFVLFIDKLNQIVICLYNVIGLEIDSNRPIPVLC